MEVAAPVAIFLNPPGTWSPAPQRAGATRRDSGAYPGSSQFPFNADAGDI